ncbi:MAG: hypothetical protein JXR96_03715 [Deltaproteobacteria bacterium]|nr:hypothetical protein [Deltaproteobacteria bacterium]
MGIWTDGRCVLLHCSTGLVRHEGELAEVLVSGQVLGRQDDPDPGRRHALSVDPGSQTAFLVDAQDRAFSMPLRGGELAELSGEIIAMASMDDRHMLAAWRGKTGSRTVVKVGLAPVPRRGNRGRKTGIALGKPKRLKWPDGLLWSGNPPWSRRSDWSGDADRLLLTDGPFGAAVADSDSGVLAVLGKGDRKYRCVLRAPAQKDARIHVCSTAEGVLVGIRLDGGESAVGHFDTAGNCLASCAFEGLEAMRVLDADRALVFSRTENELREIRLSDLDASSAVSIGRHGDGEVSIFATSDGEIAALGLGKTAILCRRGEDDTWIADSLEPPEEPEEEDELEVEHERLAGPPNLSLASPSNGWDFARGKPFAIELPLINMGGPAQGLFVEMSGQAMDQGLIVPMTVESDTKRAPFLEGRAELPGVDLAAGVAWPDSKKAKERLAEAPGDTRVTLWVRGKSDHGGEGLLMIRVGFLGEGMRGSLLRGKAIQVMDS